jgi:hypothetical protein
MKAITSIFESILRDDSSLAWSPEQVEATTLVTAAQAIATVRGEK